MNRIKLITGNKIVGYGPFGNESYPIYDWENPPEEFIDKYGNYIYEWNGIEPVLCNSIPSEEQKINFANINIEIELAKLLYQGIKNNDTWEEFKNRVKIRYQELKELGNG